MGFINSDSKSTHGSLFFALFLIPFFRPAAINMAPMLSMFKPLFAAWLLLAAVFSIFFFVRRNGRFDSVLTLFLLFVLISGVSTFYNHGNLYKWLTQYAMLLSPFLVLSTLSNDEPFKFLCSLFWILAISILLNILSYFVFPSGMYFSEDGTGSWFLGNRNGVEKTCYLAVLVASILDIHYESRNVRNAMRTLPVFAVSAFTMVYSGCGTGTFAIFVYGLLLFLGKYKTVRNVFGLPFLISACIVWFLAIVIFRLTDYLPYEEIATLLGKDLTYSSGATFTGRTYIWDYVMESTMCSPLLGLGVQDIVSIDLINECVYDSAHNTWLQIFSYGGFIGVACMCGCFGVAISKIQHMQNRELAWLFVCVSAAFLVSSMFWNSNSDTAHSFYVGSYGRGTAAAASDLDVLLVLPREEYERYDSYRGNGQSRLLQAVRDAVLSTYPSTDIRGDGQVVVLNFSDGMRFELLPAFEHVDVWGTSSGYDYADTHMGGRWLAAHPKDEQDAMREKNKSSNGLLFDTCKHIRNVHVERCSSYKLSGIVVDSFVFSAMDDWRWRDGGGGASAGTYEENLLKEYNYLTCNGRMPPSLRSPGAQQAVDARGSYECLGKILRYMAE